MAFHVGDKDIHASHGLADIVGLENKEVAGVLTRYYVVRTKDLTIWIPVDHSENGRVVRSSMVPILRSSAQLRMVMAGTRKMKTTGMLTKKPRSEASFCAKKCRKRKSHPEVMMRKAMTTMYAIGELKKERSSFFMMGSIEFTPCLLPS